jgi:hypothetical protein
VTEPSDEAEAAPTARIEVVGGGAPTPEQLAALAVGLTPVAAAGGGPVELAPAWARAGLIENVGHRRPQRPSDLDATLRLG